MKLILHLVSPDDAILAVRAATIQWKKERKPGNISIIEFENKKQFQVNENKKSISVWGLPDAP